MKVLRQVSFEHFEQLSLQEAAQLYGGTGDGYPTTETRCNGLSDCGCPPRLGNGSNSNSSSNTNSSSGQAVPTTATGAKKGTKELSLELGVSRKDGVTTYEGKVTLKAGNLTAGVTGSVGSNGAWKGSFVGKISF